jgi:hypothetical protein
MAGIGEVWVRSLLGSPFSDQELLCGSRKTVGKLDACSEDGNDQARSTWSNPIEGAPPYRAQEDDELGSPPCPEEVDLSDVENMIGLDRHPDRADIDDLTDDRMPKAKVGSRLP